MTTDQPDEPRLKLTFSDLVQLVRKEYSNESNNIGYAAAAEIVDQAIAPHIIEAENRGRAKAHLQDYELAKSCTRHHLRGGLHCMCFEDLRRQLFKQSIELTNKQEPKA